MADVVVHVKVADLEPFAQFIGKITQANDAFRSLTAEEAKALPPKAAEGMAKLQSALRTLAAQNEPSIYEAAVRAQAEGLRSLGEQTAEQMRREQARDIRRRG